jgi:hypothetical protein
MTTWTTISNAAVAVGAIPSSSTVTALRDNPVAVAESASGAPVVATGWHPYDKVSVGDGKDGLIYDHAVSGNVGSVITPDFEDGYEYRIVADEVRHNDASSRRLWLQAYFASAGAYRTLITSPDQISSGRFGFDYEILMPRLSMVAHLLRGAIYANGNVLTGRDQNSDAYLSTAQKLTRGRIIFEAGSIVGGKIWMFRRREYASSP